jgi:hypothetical protein
MEEERQDVLAEKGLSGPCSVRGGGVEGRRVVLPRARRLLPGWGYCEFAEKVTSA